LAIGPQNLPPDGFGQADLLQRQAKAAERIAEHLAPEAEERRLARVRRLITQSALRIALVIGLVLGAWELLVWAHGNWEIRALADNYAHVANEIFYKENNPQVAQSFLSQAIELNPNEPSYRFLESYIAGMAAARNLFNLDRPLTKGELDQSHDALAKAIFLEKQAPGEPESAILRGQIYAALKDYERARDSISLAINRIRLNHNEPPSSVFTTASAGLHSVFDAIGVTMLANRMGGSSTKRAAGFSEKGSLSFAYVRLALIESKQGHQKIAMNHLETALKIDPDSKWANLWKGVFYGEQKRWTEARAQYDKALAIDPRFDLAYYNRGWTYLMEKPRDYKSARSMFQKALSVNPDYKEANYGLGMVYGYQNKYQVALRYLTQAIEIDELFLTGWKWRAIVHDELGFFDQSLADFSSAISLDPANDDLYVRRARVLKKKKEYEAALEDLLLAKDFNPANYRIPFYTGQVFAELGQTDSAIDEFSKALELRPNYGEALIGRAEGYEKLGQIDLAVADFDRAVESVTYRRERVLHQRGQFFLRRDDFRSALNDFKLAREVNPRYARSWLAEAKTALRLDQRDQAKVSIDEYLKLMPRSNEALTLKKELSVNG